MTVEPAESEPASVSRRIIHGDGLTWMQQHPALPRTSVITSLPDSSELPGLGFAGWQRWFVDASRAVLRWVPEDSVAIFFQSDVLHEGRWVDKAHLVLNAADVEGAKLAWHKIVCRLAPATESWGRASYSHMLCLTRGQVPPLKAASEHVLPSAGDKSWTRGMGRLACQHACEYVRDHTPTRNIVDPFCGRGSVLAVAAPMGFSVLGVELSAKRCRAARAALRQTSGEAEPVASEDSLG